MEVTGAITLYGITDAIQVESCYKLTSRNLPPDTPHSTDDDGVIPEGWSGTLLGVSAVMPYLWESQRKKDGASWSSWSRPILKNSWGEKGAKMRSRVWEEGQYYTSGAQSEEFYDIVQYKEKLYICTKTIEEPSKEGVNDPITSESKYLGIWKSAQDWDFIATRLLLTEKINADQIDVDSIFAGTIQANDATINNFNATNVRIQSGEIGGFEIANGRIGQVDANRGYGPSITNTHMGICIQRYGNAEEIIRAGFGSYQPAFTTYKGEGLSVYQQMSSMSNHGTLEAAVSIEVHGGSEPSYNGRPTAGNRQTALRIITDEAEKDVALALVGKIQLHDKNNPFREIFGQTMSVGFRDVWDSSNNRFNRADLFFINGILVDIKYH